MPGIPWTRAETLDRMPQATSSTAIDRIMDHRVLALRDGASADPIVSLSWYTYNFTQLRRCREPGLLA